MKNSSIVFGLLLCGIAFADESSLELQDRHAPFKERLWVGPGYTPGVDNVLRGYLDAGNNAEVLVSKNIGNQPIGWRSGLDPYSWYMFNASNWENHVFHLLLKNPLRLILEANGRLHIIDNNHNDVWSRGPFGESNSYQLMISDEGPGDLILYDDAGRKVWSARRDGV